MIALIHKAITPAELKSAHSMKHWLARNKDRKSWTLELGLGFGLIDGKGAFKSKVSPELLPLEFGYVHFVRYLGKRQKLFDEDNLRSGSIKQAVDWMVNNHWLMGDNPNRVKVTYDQIKVQPPKGKLIDARGTQIIFSNQEIRSYLESLWNPLDHGGRIIDEEGQMDSCADPSFWIYGSRQR